MLTERTIRNFKPQSKTKRLFDSGGLYLEVTADQPTSLVPGSMLDFEVNGTSDEPPEWMMAWS